MLIQEMTMLNRRNTAFLLALAGALTLPSVAGAEKAGAHAEHPAPTAATAQEQTARPSALERRQVMRQRMQEIRATEDPEKRRQLLEAQIKDIEAMLEADACPLPGGGGRADRGTQGMMGQGMMGRGMQHGMGGKGMPCDMRGGMGGHGPMDEATARRLEALEKRVDLLQTLLQMQAR